MEREWLAAQFEAGKSMEAIARALDRAPSTVAYWARKHGLVSRHAARHQPRGGIERELLVPLVERGLSTRAIAAELDRSQSTVRHWLARHGLAVARRREADDVRAVDRVCARHGPARFVRCSPQDSFRCERCRRERVADRRRRVKAILVAEAGGACAVCGYDRYAGALQFHHLDPDDKRFGIARDGVARSLARSRAEAAKCALLCANCHAEVEAGITELPCGPSSGRSGPA